MDVSAIERRMKNANFLTDEACEILKRGSSFTEIPDDYYRANLNTVNEMLKDGHSIEKMLVLFCNSLWSRINAWQAKDDAIIKTMVCGLFLLYTDFHWVSPEDFEQNNFLDSERDLFLELAKSVISELSEETAKNVFHSMAAHIYCSKNYQAPPTSDFKLAVEYALGRCYFNDVYNQEK